MLPWQTIEIENHLKSCVEVFECITKVGVHSTLEQMRKRQFFISFEENRYYRLLQGFSSDHSLSDKIPLRRYYKASHWLLILIFVRYKMVPTTITRSLAPTR